MLSWLGKKMIASNMKAANAGNIAPLLKMDAEDVRLEKWLRRFADAGVQIFPDEVVLQGFPWKQTICVRGPVHLDTPEGERVYENRYVIWGHISWGKLRDYEVYEDTQQSKALDGYLASIGKL